MFSDLEGGGAGIAMATPVQPRYREATRAYRAKAVPENDDRKRASHDFSAEAAAASMAEGRGRDEDAAMRADSEKIGIFNQSDEVRLALSLSPEERRVMLSVFDEGEDAGSLSKEERETLRDAAERISKYLDEAMARSRNDRERVEKAFGEWFSRLTKGERQGPLDLINLLRQAAMGTLGDAAAVAE